MGMVIGMLDMFCFFNLRKMNFFIYACVCLVQGDVYNTRRYWLMMRLINDSYRRRSNRGISRLRGLVG